ncbi:MAG: cupredoxin domain-containing protein [Actinomycetia bacterium]|nr:cupredoxin domain-containing protein [Actinomycetes bacterium]
MKNRTLLAVGIGAIVLAFVGPAVAGAVDGQGAYAYGPFGQMRPGYMRDIGPGHMGGFGSGMMGFGGDYGSAQQTPSIQGAEEVTVTLDDFSISPEEVVISEGQETNITVVNNGAAPHDFTVPDLDIRIVVGPGETATVGVAAQPAGTYDTLCTVPGHAPAGMVGSFVVQSQA